MVINTIPPSIYNAFNICSRQAWLMAHAMVADQDHDFLKIGSLIEDDSFEREKKSIYIPEIGAKVDMVKKKQGRYQIVEIKKSSKTMASGKEQLKYYLYLLDLHGIQADGLIKIPKEKISEEVQLNEDDKNYIENMLTELRQILERTVPPPAKRIKQCPKCAHFEFCWA